MLNPESVILNLFQNLQGRLVSASKISFFISLLLLQACAVTDKVKLEGGRDYFSAFNAWTRSVRVYERLETRIYVSATYRERVLREAYVDEYARRYLLPPELKRTIMEKEMEEGERVNEFFLSVFTPVLKWNDLDRKDSIWEVYLEDDKGRRVVPVSINRVKEDDPVVREFYPSMDLWSFGYVVRFPKYTQEGTPLPAYDTKTIRLLITGAPGRAELEWRFEN